MIKGFESITSPLTDTDKRVLVPALADMLRWRVGNSLAITNTELADYCDSLREREAAIRAVRQALEGQNTKSLF